MVVGGTEDVGDSIEVVEVSDPQPPFWRFRLFVPAAIWSPAAGHSWSAIFSSSNHSR